MEKCTSMKKHKNAKYDPNNGLFRNYKHCTKCGYREIIWDVLYIDNQNMLCKKCAKENETK